ncbi:otefin-like [Anopheles marshallii]|uniref:otefin-like n=1 Tax=Anopheles marshallii TaxID=1521116 RepID=UPI00237A2561|nr:otefin-like [Anopheles marshallii]
MADNFDDMSNDQLRLKLLEFGLANMPVTTTTRKVLIKKLRNHISTNGKRRETISLTKYSSDEDSEPASSQNAAPKKGSALSKKELTSRRATIGTVASTRQPKPVSSSQPIPKVSQALPSESAAASKRRSGRVTPVNDKNVSAPPSSQTAPKVPAILEDSDDDMIPLTQLTQRSRKSASPSLSRADMLTTSYIHQMAVPAKPSEAIAEEMEVDVPEMGRPMEEEDVIVLDDDEEDASEMVSMPPPQQPKPWAGNAAYRQTTEVHRTLTTGTMTDQKMDKEKTTFEEPTAPLYTSTERTFTKPSLFASPSMRSNMSSALRDDTAKKIDTTESPYLSEFTKRLARLRAEAAEASVGIALDSPSRRTVFEGSGSSMRSAYAPRDTYEGVSSRYRAGRQTIAPMGTQGRRITTMQTETDIRSSVRQNLLALDRKYSIRKIFYTVIVVLVVIFLFVFFFL